MSSASTSKTPDIDFNTPAMVRNRKFRAFKNRLASGSIAVGGLSIIVAILLIFFYLLYEIMPLFKAASIQPWQHQQTASQPYLNPGQGETWYLALEEQAEIGLRVTDQQRAIFFNARSGEIISEQTIIGPVAATPTSFAVVSEASGIFAIGFDNGEISIVKHQYTSTYPNDIRVITPSLSYPLGETPLKVAESKIELLAVSKNDQSWTIVAGTNSALTQTNINAEENMFTQEWEITTQSAKLPAFDFSANKLLLLPGDRWLLAAGQRGKIAVFDLQADAGAKLSQVIAATVNSIQTFSLLLGDNALIIGDSLGQLSQWFLVRDAQNNWKLQKIRELESSSNSISVIAMEHRRKGFATVDSKGELRLYNTTANRNVLTANLADSDATAIAYSPRSNALLVEQGNNLQLWYVDNEHPDISWAALWEKVWYEGYPKPEYVWQSSASNNDFEPKYSLMPLAFGTLKAAFYAMLLATPLAICGAIYTAYFMAPAMRRKVKPLIELMEALPTVILGFLAGLWLAPFIETNLAGIFLSLLTIPAAILAFGYAWANLPKNLRNIIPPGWDAALLIPVVVTATLVGINGAQFVEQLLFAGDLRQWLTDEAGIPFDQRNALVVGIAMGFAVIPTIFTITEDAIFSVPKHLSYGSLALGATPWQTLVRVVLPTASPGIFSALMVGMGRAVGETMIVLMATGNTPIMDVNIFEGMRTLAANIAVEMPEAEVASTHYRVLFLAAFSLFLFTFVVNTFAEVIRHRLRNKYGSL
ncbi:MAG: binding-protein-dependent transport system inner membrane component [Osedax symbiont Rs2]|nr:MAG: binding-protein-dependent transport system inner membrane component [Osedax symbiont Rs2]